MPNTKFPQQTIPPGLSAGDTSTELWREYEWTDPVGGERIVYLINQPVTVYYGKGHSTHRVVGSDGVAHCVPAIGIYGCVLRWKSKPGEHAVNW